MAAMRRRERSGLRARDRQGFLRELTRQVRQGTYLVDPAKVATAIAARVAADQARPSRESDDERR